MDIRTVTVTGAGTMGSGIAQVCSQAGLQTHLHDPVPGAVAQGIKRIEAFWERGMELGKTTVDQRDTWRGELVAADDLDKAAGASDLVIEAAPEDLELKKRIFTALGKAAPDAILATNTSSLSIAAIAKAATRPERVLGMHFFNPVPLMRLLEIVRHEGTDDEVVHAARRVGQRLGKEVIVVRDRPGFATSRLGIALGNEAARMVDEGVASVADIDTAMKLGYGHPMGPLELSDLVGLDVRHAITEYLHQELGGRQWAPPAITKRLVEAGDLGKKTGKGFYDWSTGQAQPRSDL